MLEELLVRAHQAVALAQSSGADHAAAGASRARKVEYSFRDGALEKVQEDTSRSLSVQLYVDGRYSSHSTTDLREDRLRTFVSEAVALTRALQPDPHRSLPDPALYQGISDVDLDLVDPSLATLSRQDRIDWFERIGAGFADEPRLISWTAGSEDSHSVGVRVTSNGFEGHHERSSVWMGAEVTLQDEGDGRPEDWYWGGGHHRADLPDPATISAECLRRVRERMGSQKGPTRKGLMIVDPRAAGRLVRALLGPANARSIQQGRSFWAGKQGQALLSDRVTLWDDPLRPRGLNSRRFDGEGLAARELPVFAGGALQNLYVDTYYGKKAGLAPTTGGQSNLRWQLGERDLAAVLADAPDAVYVTSWLGGNSDGTTGDFSFGMRGHAVTQGVIGGPIGEMNVTGNLIDLFAQLVEVGSDPWPYSGMYTPTLVFDGVQFSGA